MDMFSNTKCVIIPSFVIDFIKSIAFDDDIIIYAEYMARISPVCIDFIVVHNCI